VAALAENTVLMIDQGPEPFANWPKDQQLQRWGGGQTDRFNNTMLCAGPHGLAMLHNDTEPMHKSRLSDDTANSNARRCHTFHFENAEARLQCSKSSGQARGPPPLTSLFEVMGQGSRLLEMLCKWRREKNCIFDARPEDSSCV
jgi:hypothetical protein